MGKMISLYLTEEESRGLSQFCEEKHCTQYSAMKIALRELLSRDSKDSKQPADLSPTALSLENEGRASKTEQKKKMLKELLKALQTGSV